MFLRTFVFLFCPPPTLGFGSAPPPHGARGTLVKVEREVVLVPFRVGETVGSLLNTLLTTDRTFFVFLWWEQSPGSSLVLHLPRMLQFWRDGKRYQIQKKKSSAENQEHRTSFFTTGKVTGLNVLCPTRRYQSLQKTRSPYSEITLTRPQTAPLMDPPVAPCFESAVPL